MFLEFVNLSSYKEEVVWKGDLCYHSIKNSPNVEFLSFIQFASNDTKLVLVFRVFWRTVGEKNPTKNDTKETNILITGLKDDVTYELVIKAGNQIGTSMLTDPMKFSTAEKYITSAASLGGKS